MPLLKTCPWCNGLASTLQDHDTGESVLAYCPKEGGARTFEAWNHRPREDELEAEVAELRRALLLAFACADSESGQGPLPGDDLGEELGIDPELIRRAGYVEPPPRRPPITDCTCGNRLPRVGMREHLARHGVGYLCDCGQGWMWLGSSARGWRAVAVELAAVAGGEVPVTRPLQQALATASGHSLDAIGARVRRPRLTGPLVETDAAYRLRLGYIP